ncbi:MAG: hydantoinase B/oxoprolinase family protein [Planctomycetota bacterium]
MTAHTWQFAIDVGGTFTDIVARKSGGTIVTHKLLSSGIHRGMIGVGSTGGRVVDFTRQQEPDGFWNGYRFRLIGLENPNTCQVLVEHHDAKTGELLLSKPLGCPIKPGMSYELFSDEEAPILGIRYVLGKRRHESIGPVDVRLGTTRGTNALLERKGARVLFVTTAGFRDILRIGNQARPSLFALNIEKRAELAEFVLEVDERLDATGNMLRQPHTASVAEDLRRYLSLGAEAVAICFLHAHVNPIHEDRVAGIAQEAGFSHISVSSRVSRLEGFVPRCDTTVVDAYLSKVIREYVASLQSSMPEARIQLMTSNGGLVSADSAGGKDTILSGPAGGVVGCQKIARTAGYPKTIGFDMGGTSTDVTRIDGPLEYQFETVKAGVCIMTPMLAIETVAAGGGSICSFDGQRLLVGPESAGADPGPACYGRGGPLTLTDVNVFLGRLPPTRFPFSLDREIVQVKFQHFSDDIYTATGQTLDLHELAEGWIDIANSQMAAAIKSVSLAKGHDPREYTLMSFGGAGGLHACGIARRLGIQRILASPLAGVLSAVGIEAASAKRMAQRSVRLTLNSPGRESAENIYHELIREAEAQLAKDGFLKEDHLSPIPSADLCYAGQSTVLSIPADRSWRNMASTFEALHRQLYGYVHAGRDVEIRTLRVEISTGENPSIPTLHDESLPNDSSSRSSWPISTNRLWWKSRIIDVPVFHRGVLNSHSALDGPAIVADETSTLFVEPGWKSEVLKSGELVLLAAETLHVEKNHNAEVDPIRLELFHQQFAAIAEQMGTTLRRTALSTNVKERLDFSCAVFGPKGDLVANAPHIPVHLGGMGDCIKYLMEDVELFCPGDVFITNDPYRGGSHLNDITVVTPVFDDKKSRVQFFVASRAHHADIGGKTPGSMPPDSTCLAEEGVLIRALRFAHDGAIDEAELRTLLTTSPFPARNPEENLADIAAQVAANQTGSRELLAMIALQSEEIVTAFMNHIRQAAAWKTRQALRRFAQGEHRFEDTMDDGTPIRLVIRIESDRATFDFTGTGPVSRGNLNANRSIVSSAILYCLRCLINEDIPLNAGVLEPVTIILPECFLNPPRHEDPRQCPAIAGGNVETSQRIVDVIFGALSVVAASQGTMNNLLVGHEKFGYYETICGGAGAGPGFHGADAVHTHMTNTRLTDPEVLESRYPLRLIRFEIRQGSGGRGKFHGGNGVIREIESLVPLDVSIISQRRSTAPYGLLGGGAGMSGRNLIRRKGSASCQLLAPVTFVQIEPGDRVTIETPGGGGCGSSEPP